MELYGTTKPSHGKKLKQDAGVDDRRPPDNNKALLKKIMMIMKVQILQTKKNKIGNQLDFKKSTSHIHIGEVHVILPHFWNYCIQIIFTQFHGGQQMLE